MEKRATVKRKRLHIIALIIILVVLLIPIPRYYKDGGTVAYSAIIYTVYDYKTIWFEGGIEGYLVGIEIVILGITVYDNTRFEKWEAQ